ncbi:hypothetical protein C8J56DRAFT_880002 [Mycena floridula]|nr:hypothetical protein C8J56DRAFT_880002 [Mycena floridula]
MHSAHQCGDWGTMRDGSGGQQSAALTHMTHQQGVIHFLLSKYAGSLKPNIEARSTTGLSSPLLNTAENPDSGYSAAVGGSQSFPGQGNPAGTSTSGSGLLELGCIALWTLRSQTDLNCGNDGKEEEETKQNELRTFNLDLDLGVGQKFIEPSGVKVSEHCGNMQFQLREAYLISQKLISIKRNIDVRASRVARPQRDMADGLLSWLCIIYATYQAIMLILEIVVVIFIGRDERFVVYGVAKTMAEFLGPTGCLMVAGLIAWRTNRTIMVLGIRLIFLRHPELRNHALARIKEDQEEEGEEEKSSVIIHAFSFVGPLLVINAVFFPLPSVDPSALSFLAQKSQQLVHLMDSESFKWLSVLMTGWIILPDIFLLVSLAIAVMKHKSPVNPRSDPTTTGRSLEDGSDRLSDDRVALLDTIYRSKRDIEIV